MKIADAIATRSARNRRQKSCRGERAADLAGYELDALDGRFRLDE